MIIIEQWKPVVGFEGYYEVSSIGNVRSVDRTVHLRGTLTAFKKGIILLQTIRRGYKTVTLSVNGKPRIWRVHRLVLNAFLGVKSEKDVDHINGVRDDNRLENLRWVTRQENRINTVYKGCSKTKNGKFQSILIHNGNKMCLGTFKSEKEATERYLKEKEELFPNINMRGKK